MSCRLGMFVKYWEPGKVKTRLGRSIGEVQAARIYRQFVVTLLTRFARAGNSELVFSPDDREAAFRQMDELGQSWSIHPQGEGDLGARMEAFFQRSFDAGCSRAVIIGSDSPTLPLNYVHQAEQLLQIHDVVLGPTEDGGYYLVGARGSVPPIFSDISWSTEHVWQQTIEQLLQRRVDFAVLPEWYDVDDIDGLNRLHAELSSRDTDDVTVELQCAIKQLISEHGTSVGEDGLLSSD